VDEGKQKELTNRFEKFKEEVSNLNEKDPAFNEKLDKLKKEMSELRNEFNRLGNIANTCLKVLEKRWVSSDKEENLKRNANEWSGYLKDLNTQKADQSSLLDKIQFFVSKAETGQENIDKEDSVWNFLAMEAGISFESLQTWTGATSGEEIDKCFVDLGIGTIQELIDKNVATEEELRHKKDLVSDKVKAYIEAKKSSDARSKIYSLLGTTYQSRLSPALSKLDRIVSTVTYRAMMIITVLGPIIAHPEQAVVGFGIGFLYPIVDTLFSRKISNFVQTVFSNRYGVASLFVRRQLFSLNARSQQDLQTFVDTDFLGRLRLTSFESLMGYFVTSMDIHTLLGQINHGNDSVPVGGLMQGFVLGKDFNSSLGSLVSRSITPLRSFLANRVRIEPI
jgi:hypothetical protein